ncbi:MAG TPA: FUSC family membrane protein [Arenibacter sp.]|nr:FUSC family membrane protein [Arenibacter sp.]
MPKDLINPLTIYFKSAYFFRACITTIAVLIPLLSLGLSGYSDYAIPIAIGIFLNAPSDIPGSLKRKVYGILISVGLTMLITLVVSLSRMHFWWLLSVISLLSFSLSLLAVYGFRGSLISFSGLLAMVLALAHGISTLSLWQHILLIGLGGIFYLAFSLLVHSILPKKDEDQLLSDTLSLTGDYLALRGRLLTETRDREHLMRKIFALQSKINEKHEVLRELLLLAGKRTGKSHFDEKRLLIFISLVDILELSLANTLDYQKIDTLFEGQQHQLQLFEKVNHVFGNHLNTLAENVITKKRIPSNEPLLKVLSIANDAIQDYIEQIGLPKAREGALILKNLHDYQNLQLQKIRAVRRALANTKDASRLSLKNSEAHQFITDQEYGFNIVLENISLQSPIFRHALRLTSAVILAYICGTAIGIKNTYWILLTLIVIMRPYYGLTKERSINRVVGTLIGALVATGIIFLTQNPIIYGILATVSLTISFSLIQQSYRSAAAFITINVIFIYSLLTPNAIEIIQYRVLDTALGAVLAIIANYLFWPHWEYRNLDKFLLESIRANTDYLIAIRNIYRTKHITALNYKIPRKEAFLAVGNLNAAFQRMTQDPKSK